MGRVLQDGDQLGFVPLEGTIVCECPTARDGSRACICRTAAEQQRGDSADDADNADGDADDGHDHVRLDSDGALRLRTARAWLGAERFAELMAASESQRDITGEDDLRELFIATISAAYPDIAAQARSASLAWLRSFYDGLPMPQGFHEHGSPATKSAARTDAGADDSGHHRVPHHREERNAMSARDEMNRRMSTAWAEPGDATNLTPAQQQTARVDALVRVNNAQRDQDHRRQIRSDALGRQLGRFDAESANDGEEDETPFEELQRVQRWAKENGVELDKALRYLEEIRESRAKARESGSKQGRARFAMNDPTPEDERVDAREASTRGTSARQRMNQRMHDAWRQPTDKLDKGVA
jgi:hypothetical protein